MTAAGELRHSGRLKVVAVLVESSHERIREKRLNDCAKFSRPKPPAPSCVPVFVDERLTALLEKLTRYDLVQYGGYYKDHRIEPSEGGDYVRFDELEAVLGLPRDGTKDAIKVDCDES